MKTTLPLLLAGLFTLCLALPAFAGGCPGKMAEIDQKLASGPMLEGEVIEEIIALRTEGEAAHQRGEHDAAMEALGEALAILEEEAAAASY